jgi:hypothetical protein
MLEWTANSKLQWQWISVTIMSASRTLVQNLSLAIDAIDTFALDTVYSKLHKSPFNPASAPCMYKIEPLRPIDNGLIWRTEPEKGYLCDIFIIVYLQYNVAVVFHL